MKFATIVAMPTGSGLLTPHMTSQGLLPLQFLIALPTSIASSADGIKGKLAIQKVLDRFKIGRIEQDQFRFCDRAYVQHPGGTIVINCRGSTRARRPIDSQK